MAEIVNGDKSATSITSHYISGTSYVFSIEIEFSKFSFGEFQIKVSVDRAISLKYFSPISTHNHIIVPVKPSYLALKSEETALE